MAKCFSYSASCLAYPWETRVGLWCNGSLSTSFSAPMETLYFHPPYPLGSFSCSLATGALCPYSGPQSTPSQWPEESGESTSTFSSWALSLINCGEWCFLPKWVCVQWLWDHNSGCTQMYPQSSLPSQHHYPLRIPYTVARKKMDWD